MLRLISDEHFAHRVVRGLRRIDASIDVVRVQDVGLRTKSDDEILDWAAAESRVLLTHDRRTIPRHVKSRIAAGLPTYGAVVINRTMRIRLAIEQIRIVAHCTDDPAEWTDRIMFLPM